MGVPDKQGSYNVQLSPFLQRKDGVTKGDMGGHLSIGMFDWGGVHLRSLGASTTPTTEIITMVALKRSESGKEGVSFLGIIGVPTNNNENDGDEHAHNDELSYLLGITTRKIFQNRLTWDAILHYDFKEKHFIPESGFVYKTNNNLFATLDARAIIGEKTEIYFLPGIKYRLSQNGFLGFGYQTPIGPNSKFQNQIYLQFEFGKH